MEQCCQKITKYYCNLPNFGIAMLIKMAYTARDALRIYNGKFGEAIEILSRFGHFGFIEAGARFSRVLTNL